MSTFHAPDSTMNNAKTSIYIMNIPVPVPVTVPVLQLGLASGLTISDLIFAQCNPANPSACVFTVCVGWCCAS